MQKIDRLIELRKFNLDKADFVLKHFKDIVISYEDLNSVNLEAVLQWQTKKVKNQNEFYFEIYYTNNFVGVIKFYNKGLHYELDDFYIDESYRNKGIGGKVLRYFIQQSIKEKLPIELCVFKKNVKAINFYKQHDFSVFEDLGTRVIMVNRTGK